MAEMTRKDPTISRELELMRRGIGSTRPITNLNQFSQYLKEQEPSARAEDISKGFEPIRRGIGKYTLNPLATLQDLAAGAGEGLYGLAADASGGIASALGAPEFGQDMFNIADKSYDSAKGRFSEALGPGQVIKDKGFSPADNEQLLDIFGPDPSIGRPEGMVPGKATIKPGTEGLPKKQIPDPSSNVDAAARLMMEQSQTKADARREISANREPKTMYDMPSEPVPDADPAEQLFSQAMSEYISQARTGAEDDLPKIGDIEDYKKKFAEATGVDISGKPDTSQALMAMGLSMMQNRAGKGFNVGKMLSAVGEAGEKAMPELSRARQEAKAAKVAAGKYALGQIEKGESAAAAIAAEDKAFQRERYLKLLQMDADFEKERIKAGGKVAEVKNVKADKVINGLTVQRGRGATGAVFVFPQDALRDTAGALKSVNGALGTVDTMTDLATQIANEESPTFSLLRDRVNTALVGAGLADAEVVFGDAKIGNEQQMKIFQQSIITQFKRMLTQETGNGISAKDVEQINLMLGQIDLLGNPQGSLKRLAEIKTLFMGKRRAIRGVLDELQDPELYPTEGEYTKNMELYPTLIEGNTAYRTVNGQGSPIDVADPK